MPDDEPFVLFMFPCRCGTNLQVHGQYFIGYVSQGKNCVACPKCKQEHDLPTKALRFFYQDGDRWLVSFLGPPN